jgi:hypothetical protein
MSDKKDPYIISLSMAVFVIATKKKKCKTITFMTTARWQQQMTVFQLVFVSSFGIRKLTFA